ncbi:hypothetical protein [Robertkochia solimangrovi]|nr:hypothetical protein [Robertkochia solimangrovi]
MALGKGIEQIKIPNPAEFISATFTLPQFPTYILCLKLGDA